MIFASLEFQESVGLQREASLHWTEEYLNDRPDDCQIDNVHEGSGQLLGHLCRHFQQQLGSGASLGILRFPQLVVDVRS